MLQWLLPALLITVWMKGMNRSKQAYSSSITATPVYDLVELLLSVQCLQISFNCKDILNFRCWEAEQQQQQQWGHRLSFTILSRAGGCRGRWRLLLGLSTLCGWSPEHWTRSIQTRVPQFGHIFGKSLYTISQCSNLKCISVFTKRACIRFQIVIAVLWAKVVSFTEYKRKTLVVTFQYYWCQNWGTLYRHWRHHWTRYDGTQSTLLPFFWIIVMIFLN